MPALNNSRTTLSWVLGIFSSLLDFESTTRLKVSHVIPSDDDSGSQGFFITQRDSSRELFSEDMCLRAEDLDRAVPLKSVLDILLCLRDDYTTLFSTHILHVGILVSRVRIAELWISTLGWSSWQTPKAQKSNKEKLGRYMWH